MRLRVIRLIAVIISCCLIFGITSCGKSESSTLDNQSNTTTTEKNDTDGSADSSSSDDSLSGEITFWHSFTQGARMEAVQSAAEKFMDMHPDVKISIETYSWGDFNTKWNAGLTTGDLPDMSTAQNTGEVVEMLNSDVLRPVDSLIDKVGRDRFAENALKDMTIEGIEYGVPYYSHAQVMWYRSDLLAAAGLKVPETWDEFYEAAVKLTENGTFGAAFSSSPNDLLCTRYLNYYVRSGGGSLLTEDLKADLTSELAIEGINFWIDVYKNCSPAETINYTVLDHATLFYQGKTVFDFNSGFMISGVQNNTPEIAEYVDCAMLPRMKADDPIYSAEATHIPLVVWDKAEYPEVCEAFIEFLYSDDNYIEFLEAVPVGMLPALRDIAENPAYLANESVKSYSNAVDVISQAIDMGRAIGFEHGPSAQASFLTSQGVIESMFQDILTNGTPVEEAAEQAEKKLNDIFDTMIG